MNKTFLKKLAIASYKNGELDQKTAFKIADRLSKKDLKQYIRIIKASEKAKNIYLTTALGDKNTEKQLKYIFKDKNIIVNQDSSMMLGSRIEINDDIFEMNLKNTLENIIENIDQNND